MLAPEWSHVSPRMSAAVDLFKAELHGHQAAVSSRENFLKKVFRACRFHVTDSTQTLHLLWFNH